MRQKNFKVKSCMENNWYMIKSKSKLKKQIMIIIIFL